MMGHLEENPVGKILAGVCAGLMAVLLLLGVAWTLPPSGGDSAEGEGAVDPNSEVPQLQAAEPIETYAEITDRPVFNESRQPVIGAEDGGEEEEFAGDEDVDAPQVVLAGVVITPELRIATLRLKEGDASLVALEGQPLEGDFGSWRLSRIEPRHATLESAAGRQVYLELQVHDAMIEEPPEVKAARQAAAVESAQADQQQEDGEAAEDRPLTRAEEIRQRIAERREELRRAAEEADPSIVQSPQVDYRQAIQAMMAGKKNQEQDESEQ